VSSTSTVAQVLALNNVVMSIYAASVEVTNLCELGRTQLFDLLRDYHDIFALEENDKGKTDLIQLEVDTGDVMSVKQPTRKMPFAAREEVVKQLRKMRQMQILQSSRSPWSSPVVLVRKKERWLTQVLH